MLFRSRSNRSRGMSRCGSIGHASKHEHGAASPNILPAYLPLFSYHYREHNENRCTRTINGFVCNEYVDAMVVTCLRNSNYKQV